MLNQLIFIALITLFSTIKANTIPEIAIGDSVNVTTQDGHTLVGIVESENDDSLILKTSFGSLPINRSQISSINALIAIEPSQKPQKLLNQQKTSVKSTLNQEARWRTIYSTMLLGNGLYGWGVPFVLGVTDGTLMAASQAFAFGGGFYAAYSYTKNMELPYGRWQFQSAGAALGGLSFFPLVVTVGIDNWTEFDNSGKISMLYIMSMIPYGVVQADKRYNEWSLTNGQASVISGSIPWGFANALGALTLAYGENWPDNAVMNRLHALALYGAGYGAPFFAKQYIQDKSYTEDDALYIGFSMGLGMFNALSTISLLEADNIRAITALMIGITNGYGYLANSLIEDKDLRKGDLRIISLGTGAAFIIRTGFGILFEEVNPFSKTGILLNMAALNTGWYYTFKWVAGDNHKNSYLKENKKGISLSLKPILMSRYSSPIPGLRLQATFF